VLLSLLSLVRLRQAQPVSRRDLAFLVGLAITFGLEVFFGLKLASRGHDPDAADTIAVLVIVCFLIGVARSWELVGGPSFGLFAEVRALAKRAPPRRSVRSRYLTGASAAIALSAGSRSGRD
jgi:hypothetical protein